MKMVAIVIFRIAIITLITPLVRVDGHDVVLVVVDVDQTGLVDDIAIVLELVTTVDALVVVGVLETVLVIVVVVHITGMIKELLIVVHVTQRV